MRLLLALTVALLPLLETRAQSELECSGLRVEHLENPTGIDVAKPRFRWQLKSTVRGQRQTASHILVASSPEALARDEGDLWDSGQRNDWSNFLTEYRGAPLKSGQTVYWKVRAWDKDRKEGPWSEPAQFTMGVMKPEEWKAQWISFKDDTPLHQEAAKLHLPAPRYYRKPFKAGKPVKHAVVFASALGIYELHLNGAKVGDSLLAPGWSDYRKRVYYNTHVVTDLLKEGDNCLGATVADGWYAGYLGAAKAKGFGPHGTGRGFYGKTPALLAQLHVEYEDGSVEVITTDPSWQVSTGPELEADLLMGESYDARRELSGWSTAAFKSDKFVPAVAASDTPAIKAPFFDGLGEREVDLAFRKPVVMEAYPAQPVRVTETLPAREVTRSGDDKWIFDLGRIIAGTVQLKVKGESGQAITLRHGEVLDAKGRLVTANLGEARATDTYICKGDPAGETWFPRFTTHGFRYVEVSGLKGEPPLDTITGRVIHNDMARTSGFECSDERVNRIFENSVWTQRANSIELPTNNPQRDRLGSVGLAQFGARSALYHFDAFPFYAKWFRELGDARIDGLYPTTAPLAYREGPTPLAAGWSDGALAAPHAAWWMAGDFAMIQKHWKAMEAFMEARKKADPEFKGSKNGLPWGDLGHLDDPTPIEFLDLCYFALDCRLMIEMASLAGSPTDHLKYADWFNRAMTSFSEQYLNEDGSLKVKSQGAHAIALRFGLVPKEHRERAAADLVALLQAKAGEGKSGLTAGDLGTNAMLSVLTWTGHQDTALSLLQSAAFPSWGQQVENGATTVWERENRYEKTAGIPEGGESALFCSNRFNAMSAWMMSKLAGISAHKAGFRHIRIEPWTPSAAPAADGPEPITWVKAHYDSTHGRISVHWRREKERFLCDVTIPPNTTATITLPVGAEDPKVFEGGLPLRDVEDVKFAGLQDNKVNLHFESGTYKFETR